MDMLLMLGHLRAQVVRFVVTFFVFFVLYKFVLPLITKEVKIDLMIIIVILYLLFLVSLKIWAVW